MDQLFGLMSTAEFPTRLPEKLKAIRERLGMTPDQLAPFVGAKTGAAILAYENDEDDLLVSVLWGYCNRISASGRSAKVKISSAC